MPFTQNPPVDRTHEPNNGLVFGNAKRLGNPIDAAEIPIVRDNDVAIGQAARPT